MKTLNLLGSTGSIGTQTLRIAKQYPDEFSVKYLSAHRNVALLSEQAKHFQPEAVCIADADLSQELASQLPKGIELLAGREALLELAARPADLMVNALVGAPGMEPTIRALKAGVDIALSNKESMVMAGDLINELLEKHGRKLFPIDSEHSAIWQSIQGEDNEIAKIILTASGGPFRNTPATDFSKITKAQALDHPNWDMGAKITIDSATMMNKGLEVIEAVHLFRVPVEDVEIVVHPESIIHSLVEFADGSQKAQLGLPSMIIPIQYALTYPRRLPSEENKLRLQNIGKLHFEAVDMQKFRCIALAYDAIRQGGCAPVVLNVTNDHAVDAFLNDRIAFHQIPELIEAALGKVDAPSENSLQAILDTANRATDFAISQIRNFQSRK